MITPMDVHNQTLAKNVHPPDWVNPEPAPKYNLVVIGAGTAGLVTAAGAAGLGAKVALIEKHLLGGDCLNVGCVPSKALIRASRAYADVRDAGEYGITVPEGARVDFPKVMERMRRLRAQISSNDSVHRFKNLGVDVFLGEAKFTHTADAMARIVIQNALFMGRKKASALTIPWCTYTDPEIAHVGLYEKEANEKGIKTDTFVQEFKDLDRAILDGESEGLIKVHVKKGTDKILGATIVARHAGEMLNELTLAIAAKISLGKIANVDVVVFSRNVKDTEERHRVRAVQIREMHKDAVLQELKQLHLFVLGGGGILFDGLAEEMLRDVNWAKELGIPVMTYAISAGPLKNPEIKQLVVQTLNKVDKITVREGEAKKILHDLGVNQEIEVTADPALLLKPQTFTKELLKKEGIDPEVSLIGFSVREPGPAAPDLNVEQYHAVLANAADFMAERYGAQILFVPMEQGEHRDLQHSHAVVSKMANAQRAQVLKGHYTSAQTLGLMAHMVFAVGMRLHFLIFAGIHKVPFVPLPYASKVTGFIADLEMTMPTITDLNVGKLCAFLDRCWDTRKTLAKQIEERIPPLQERAKQTNQILCELLRSLPASA